DRVALVKLFPGIKIDLYSAVFNKEDVDAVVIETFGAGNAPNNESFKRVIGDFISNGGLVLNITQCNSGSVEQGLYKSSSMFAEIGVISGRNLTTEAAMTKLMVCVDPSNPEQSKRKISENLRGELD
ncbi:MAG: L-asparaginase 1, partial [Crocinitomicaceae bacterium]|nr:L-asparaginase 1 [Crocinitomicaceae bacterium]